MKVQKRNFVQPRSRAECVLLVFIAAAAVCQVPVWAARTVGNWVPVYEGIWRAAGSETSPRPMRVNALRIDLSNPYVSMFATPSNGGSPLETNLQTTPSFMSAYGLKAAVNANFFSASGSCADPWGLVISNGSIVSNAQSGTFSARLCITANNIASLYASGGNPSGIFTAVGGAEIILSYGSNIGANPDIQPRTVMGISSAGRFLIMVVIDGRQPGYSEGCNHAEAAQWLLDFGAYHGCIFDGGGSSCICTAADGVLNSPSDGSPRAVGANLGANSANYNPRMDAWIIGNSDGTVKKKTWTQLDSWSSAWGGYGAPACGIDLANGVTAVSRGPQLIDLFVIGTDNMLYRRTYDGNNWNSWYAVSSLPAGVTFTSGLDACSWDIDRIDIVMVGDDGHLYRKTANIGIGWNSWVDEGGSLDPGKRPSIVSWGPGRLDIFAAAANGSGIMHKRYNGSDWLTWVQRDGVPIYGLDACSASYGTVHVFYTVGGGNIYRRTYDSDGTWSAATNLGGSFNSAPGAVSYKQGQLMVFCRDAATGACWRRNYENGSWGSWNSSLGGVSIGGPDACSWSNDSGTH